MKKVILIGAGDRGTIYSTYALEKKAGYTVIAVAEPDEVRRKIFAERHGISNDKQFNTWEDVLRKPAFADGVIIATPDHLHVEPARAALKKNYHVLLEKPMALNRGQLHKLSSALKTSKGSITVCHVLRYTNFFSTVKSLLDQGAIGDALSMYHAENVSYHHMAHSYVRGNWNNSKHSSPMILAKSCHDLDLIQWFAGSRPISVASVGNLSHFASDNAPEGSPERCTLGCPVSSGCLYDAVETYLHGTHMKKALKKNGPLYMKLVMHILLRWPAFSSVVPFVKKYVTWKEWPTSTVTSDLTEHGILKALEDGPYGRCVYQCDNDQVDHQETIIKFENGITASFKMHGHSDSETRTLRIDGTRGTLKGVFGGKSRIEVHDHVSGKRKIYPVTTDIFGHAEGDRKIMKQFLQVMDGDSPVTSLEESLVSHLLALDAYRSMTTGKTVLCS